MQNTGPLSFDRDKVCFVKEQSGGMTVWKKTTSKENQQIITAQKHIDQASVVLESDTITVHIVPRLEWLGSEEILITKFVEGIDMETLLKNVEDFQRNRWVLLTREFLHALRKTGFLWGDCAPRNILIDQTNKSIWLCDFERELNITTSPVQEKEFTRYLRNYAWEEFSCFLFPEEQNIVFHGLMCDEGPQIIQSTAISSKRKKKLLSNLFGIKAAYKIEELRVVEQIMVSVATPFIYNNKPFWPMLYLDQINEKGGSDQYASTVQRIRNLENTEIVRELISATANLP